MRLRRQRHTILRATSILIITAALIWLGGFIWFTVGLPNDVKDPKSFTDGVVVLTGGSDRLASGLDILAAGKAKKLFVSGVHQLTSITQLQRLLKREPKIFECCVILGRAAENTAGNAIETSLWAAQEGYKSLRVVTAAYHMPRSLLEFRRAMPSVLLIEHPVFPSHVKLSQWWRWPGTTSLIITEFSKYLLSLAWMRFLYSLGDELRVDT